MANTMKSERRNHHRHTPKNIQANVHSVHSANPTKPETSLSGEIIDISLTGIRLKLSKPLGKSVNDILKITLISPESGTPFTVHGTLKHLHSDTEYGVHYTHHVEGSIDDILFECVKLNDSMLLIKHL